VADAKSKRSGRKSSSSSSSRTKRSSSKSGGSSSSSSSKSSGGSSKQSTSGGSSSKSTSGGSSKQSSSGTSESKKRSAREVVVDAVSQVQELIGRPVEAVTGMEKNGSEWTVMVEVVELERIPNTTDVLGVYEITLDKDGELTGARRTRRFYRSEAGED
jgi:Gas vesicle synthesis protein GvpO